MNKRLILGIAAVLSAFALHGITVHRSFRGGYPAEARSATVARRSNVLTNSVKVVGGFSKFRIKSWVTCAGKVTRILDDDLEPPCHQRFILSDESGHTILIANNIDGWERLADVNVGDVIAFRGEFISNPQGGVVHRTHPDNSHRKPDGWLKKLKCTKRGYPCEKAEGRP